MLRGARRAETQIVSSQHDSEVSVHISGVSQSLERSLWSVKITQRIPTLEKKIQTINWSCLQIWANFWRMQKSLDEGLTEWLNLPCHRLSCCWLVWFSFGVGLLKCFCGGFFVSFCVPKELKRSGNANGYFGLFCCVERFCASYLGNCCSIEFGWMCCQLQESTVAFQEMGKSVKCRENINACNVIPG